MARRALRAARTPRRVAGARLLRPRDPPGARARPRSQSRGDAARLVARTSSAASATRRPRAIRSRSRSAPRSTPSRCRATELEAMLDARLEEIAPPDDFDLAAFEDYAGESEGRAAPARRADLRRRERDSTRREAHAPAGLALALTRMLVALPAKAGAAPTLFPVDARAAPRRDACAISTPAARAPGGRRGLRRAAGARPRTARRGGATAQDVAAGDPAGLRPARGACASISTGWSATPRRRSTRPARPRRSAASGRSGAGRAGADCLQRGFADNDIPVTAPASRCGEFSSAAARLRRAALRRSAGSRGHRRQPALRGRIRAPRNRNSGSSRRRWRRTPSK